MFFFSSENCSYGVWLFFNPQDYQNNKVSQIMRYSYRRYATDKQFLLDNCTVDSSDRGKIKHCWNIITCTSLSRHPQ